MSVTSFYPVVTSADVPTATAFYRATFGFETAFQSDWYASLKLAQFELAILHHDHPTMPAEFSGLPAGVILNLEVDDVDAWYGEIADRVEIVHSLRDEAFGQRHFLVAGPDRVLIDIIQPIEPSAEFTEAFTAV